MIPEHYLFDTFRGKRLQLGVTGSIAAYKALKMYYEYFVKKTIKFCKLLYSYVLYYNMKILIVI